MDGETTLLMPELTWRQHATICREMGWKSGDEPLLQSLMRQNVDSYSARVIIQAFREGDREDAINQLNHLLGNTMDEVKKSSEDQPKTLSEKLLTLQGSIEPIVKGQVNPHFKNRYYDINSLLGVVKPLLNEVGLVLTQPISFRDGRNVLETIIQDTKTGDKVETSIALPDGQDPQKMGSAITYYRRYSLTSLLGLQAEDDDGNAATNNQVSAVPKPAPAKNVGAKPVDQGAVKLDNLGICKDCGQPNTRYSTGTIGCSKYCWKNKPTGHTNVQQEMLDMDEAAKMYM